MISSSKTAHLTSHLGYWLRYVSNHVSHAFAQKVEREGVTVAEWVVMRQLYGEEALAPSRLAEALDLTRGAVSKLADRLIAKQLIVREENKSDGRAHTLALTAQGRKLVPKLAALADKNDAEFFAHLTAADRDTLKRILQKIIEQNDLKTIPLS